ncbi:hypothetical protein FRC03_008794 [Tulasnella sp. 419]|nr:hypothetical protein FRC03_008794 [Tulasnella sp. 419]
MVTASQNGDLRADELIRELEKLVAAAGASTSAIAGNEMGTMFMEDDGKLPNWNDDISSSLALSIEQLLSMALPPVPPLENMPVSASPLEPNPVVASQPAPNPLALQPNPVSVEVTDLLPMSLPLELAFSQSTVSDATTAAIMDDGANSYGGSLTIDLGSAGEFGDVGNALSMVDDWLNTSMSTDTAGWNFMTLEDCLESSLVLPDVGGSGKRKSDDDEVSRIKSFEESVAEPRTVKRMRLINE